MLIEFSYQTTFENFNKFVHKSKNYSIYVSAAVNKQGNYTLRFKKYNINIIKNTEPKILLKNDILKQNLGRTKQ